jgi:hypothetical protein
MPNMRNINFSSIIKVSFLVLYPILGVAQKNPKIAQNTEGYTSTQIDESVYILKNGILNLQPDTSLLNQYVFDLHFQNDSSVVFRTNRHLKYFNPYEQLFVEIWCISEGFKGEHTEENATLLRRPQTLWTVSNIRLKMKGTYMIRFFTYPRVGVIQKVVEYSFMHTTKQPIDQHYISINYLERDKD